MTPAPILLYTRLPLMAPRKMLHPPFLRAGRSQPAGSHPARACVARALVSLLILGHAGLIIKRL